MNFVDQNGAAVPMLLQPALFSPKDHTERRLFFLMLDT
jgi:hypothetical protein